MKIRTRITVGVLASIKDGQGRLLCKLSMRDGQWKPLGGTLNITEDIIKALGLNPFTFDKETMYSTNEKDFRIFKELGRYEKKGLIKNIINLRENERKMLEQIFKKNVINNLSNDSIFQIPYFTIENEIAFKLTLIPKEKSVLNVDEINIQFIFDVEDKGYIENVLIQSEDTFFKLVDYKKDDNVAQTVKWVVKASFIKDWRQDSRRKCLGCKKNKNSGE